MTHTTPQNYVREQADEVRKYYPGLVLDEHPGGGWVLHGDFHFLATNNGREVEDTYKLEIRIPADYPDQLPVTWEMGGRIPRDFHLNHNRSLCLETPTRIRQWFDQNPTLLGYLQGPVMSFLFSHHVFEATGEMPFGEWRHGKEGIYDSYKELLGVEDPLAIVAFVKILVDDLYRGHHHCPCQSGKILRKCHGPRLLAIMKDNSRDELLYEAIMVILHVKEDLNVKVPRDLLPTSHPNPKQLQNWADTGKMEAPDNKIAGNGILGES